jgi:hypothetical protein
MSGEFQLAAKEVDGEASVGACPQGRVASATVLFSTEYCRIPRGKSSSQHGKRPSILPKGT